MEKYYRAEETAAMVGISLQTLNIWYAFKRLNPNSERAQMIPDCIQADKHMVRYWTKNDIKKLKRFKETVKHGRNGVMGSITQRYVKKKGQDK